MNKPWRSGIIFTAINFLTGLGNLAFQIVLGHHLKAQGQYSQANSAINGLMPMLSLVPLVAVFTVTHYIAHFKAIGDSGRLQGLLAGCRRFLFHVTLIGSALAVAAIKPLSIFFHYSLGLMLATLLFTLVGLWTSLATALCQGLAWFYRLALLGFLAMLLRVSFGWLITLHWPSPQTAVLASTFGLLAYVLLLAWRREIAVKAEPVSPWNHEFILYLVVSTAVVVGQYCFMNSDLMVMQRYFTAADGDAYVGAERLAVSLPITVAPLLTVLFTHRSSGHTSRALREQLELVGLYTFGLTCGAVCLLFLRTFCLKLIFGGHVPPAAAAMIKPLALTMVFVGLLQAISTWALASRWSKVAVTFGILGLIYWIVILTAGRTPASLLRAMPIASAIALLILAVVWFYTLKRHSKIAQPV
ncbi:MAG: hypothetical protein KGJ88_04730 [Verrucomicrobiota bacterium]|nr:hypothetical protein [Verrucomicrobiota bacterium]